MSYDVADGLTLLEALNTIKTTTDSSLVFRHGCRSGVCGSCAVRVNGKEVLACEYHIQEDDYIEPLANMPRLRDLATNKEPSIAFMQTSQSFLDQHSGAKIDAQNIDAIEIESDCILCTSCFSACPMYESKPNFIAPFALMKNYRFMIDNKEANKKGKIDAVVQEGIFDCTLCGNCTAVCPQHIDIKRDIMMLQSMASQYGHQNPNMASFGSFGLDF